MSTSDDTEAVFYISYRPESPNHDDPAQSVYEQEQAALLASYHAAWSKCLARMQEAIKSLYTPTARSIVESVRQSHLQTLPALPYPELPVVYVPDSAGATYLIPEVTSQLEDASPDSELGDHIVNHIFPMNCPNISQCMKSLINGFMNKYDHDIQTSRKPSLSLSDNNIELLLAWYECFKDPDDPEGSSPKLVAILHDIEQFNSDVLIDMFHICHLYADRIPLVFILVASSPLPSFFNATYPISTLCLLRLQYVDVPDSSLLLDEIIMQAFFDIRGEPDLVIGPSDLLYLIDYFEHNNASVDTALTLLQIVHMRHFEENITLFNQPHNAGDSDAFSSSSLHMLLSRFLWYHDQDAIWTKVYQSSEALLDQLKVARKEFYNTYRKLAIGVNAMRTVYYFLKNIGHPSMKRADPRPWLKVVAAILDAEYTHDVSQISAMIKNLSPVHLSSLGSELHRLFEGLPNNAVDRGVRRAAQAQITDMVNSVESKDGLKVANKAANWLESFLSDHLSDLRECTLAEIWLTGSVPFPSELVNPATRGSILTGLLRPHDHMSNEVDGRAEVPPSWDNTDTGILFSLYQESGRLINVHDWFDAFCLTVEQQNEEDEMDIEEDEENDRQLQARFIRALHELDYLGLVKHTGRKKDHIMRTAFDTSNTLL